MKYIVAPWENREPINNLAARFGVTQKQLIDANPVLNTMPVKAGMILTIPKGWPVSLPKQGYIEYVVQPGDSIYKIAKEFRLNYKNVIAQNPQLTNPAVLWPGEIIYLIYTGIE